LSFATARPATGNPIRAASGDIFALPLEHIHPDGPSVVAPVPADYAGPQGEFAGVDQMNVRLPRSLNGSGDVYGYLEVDGKRAALLARLRFK